MRPSTCLWSTQAAPARVGGRSPGRLRQPHRPADLAAAGLGSRPRHLAGGPQRPVGGPRPRGPRTAPVRRQRSDRGRRPARTPAAGTRRGAGAGVEAVRGVDAAAPPPAPATVRRCRDRARRPGRRPALRGRRPGRRVRGSSNDGRPPAHPARRHVPAATAGVPRPRARRRGGRDVLGCWSTATSLWWSARTGCPAAIARSVRRTARDGPCSATSSTGTLGRPGPRSSSSTGAFTTARRVIGTATSNETWTQRSTEQARSGWATARCSDVVARRRRRSAGCSRSAGGRVRRFPARRAAGIGRGPVDLGDRTPADDRQPAARRNRPVRRTPTTSAAGVPCSTTTSPPTSTAATVASLRLTIRDRLP